MRLGDGRWGLIIGDVCGKGAQAASLTALSRYTVRAVAMHESAPTAVLRELNTVLLADPGLDERFCAAVYAHLEQDVCGAWVTLACAAHPLPIVVRRAGWVDIRGQAGTLLGLFEDPDLDEDRVGLGPGDALLFCTDGITEARNAAGEQFADEELFTVLLRCAGAPAEEIADEVTTGALSFTYGQAHDDTAVVVVRVPEDGPHDDHGRAPRYPLGQPHWGNRARPEPPREARMALTPAPSSAPTARRFVAGVLHSWRMSELVGGDAELLTTEMVANVLRHTTSSPTVIVRYDGDHVRVEVGDGSPALPARRQPDDQATSGRGLQIVELVAHDWGTIRTVDGKRVWFTLPVPAVP